MRYNFFFFNSLITISTLLKDVEICALLTVMGLFVLQSVLYFAKGAVQFKFIDNFGVWAGVAFEGFCFTEGAFVL
jgi:hypothetical protein